MGFLSFKKGRIRRSWVELLLIGFGTTWLTAIAASNAGNPVGDPVYLIPFLGGCAAMWASIFGLLYCCDCGVD